MARHRSSLARALAALAASRPSQWLLAAIGGFGRGETAHLPRCRLLSHFLGASVFQGAGSAAGREGDGAGGQATAPSLPMSSGRRKAPTTPPISPGQSARGAPLPPGAPPRGRRAQSLSGKPPWVASGRGSTARPRARSGAAPGTPPPAGGAGGPPLQKHSARMRSCACADSPPAYLRQGRQELSAVLDEHRLAAHPANRNRG